MLVYDQQVNFLLQFGAEKASKLLEKWDTSFKPKIIKEAKHLTQSADWDSDMTSLLLLPFFSHPQLGRRGEPKNRVIQWTKLYTMS